VKDLRHVTGPSWFAEPPGSLPIQNPLKEITPLPQKKLRRVDASFVPNVELVDVLYCSRMFKSNVVPAPFQRLANFAGSGIFR
jgi:hypothetical protein